MSVNIISNYFHMLQKSYHWALSDHFEGVIDCDSILVE